jgi:hypothetical protein
MLSNLLQWISTIAGVISAVAAIWALVRVGAVGEQVRTLNSTVVGFVNHGIYMPFSSNGGPGGAGIAGGGGGGAAGGGQGGAGGVVGLPPDTAQERH